MNFDEAKKMAILRERTNQIKVKRIMVEPARKEDQLIKNLDSLFGSMPFGIFKKSFKQNVDLNIDNSFTMTSIRCNHIKTIHVIKSNTRGEIDIRKLPHMRALLSQPNSGARLVFCFD
jgi:hypothetical protein